MMIMMRSIIRVSRSIICQHNSNGYECNDITLTVAVVAAAASSAENGTYGFSFRFKFFHFFWYLDRDQNSLESVCYSGQGSLFFTEPEVPKSHILKTKADFYWQIWPEVDLIIIRNTDKMREYTVRARWFIFDVGLPESIEGWRIISLDYDACCFYLSIGLFMVICHSMQARISYQSIPTHTYIYIYIKRERERGERKRENRIKVYICVFLFLYIYIYIYIYI